jgi:hypothetical protein
MNAAGQAARVRFLRGRADRRVEKSKGTGKRQWSRSMRWDSRWTEALFHDAGSCARLRQRRQGQRPQHTQTLRVEDPGTFLRNFVRGEKRRAIFHTTCARKRQQQGRNPTLCGQRANGGGVLLRRLTHDISDCRSKCRPNMKSMCSTCATDHGITH